MSDEDQDEPMSNAELREAIQLMDSMKPLLESKKPEARTKPQPRPKRKSNGKRARLAREAKLARKREETEQWLAAYRKRRRNERVLMFLQLGAAILVGLVIGHVL